jgi:hypothetical protein
MAAQFLDSIRARVASVCAGEPFRFTQALEPFSFDRQPTGDIDEVFRVEAEGGKVIGGMGYSETRQDVLRIWVARKYSADPDGTYQTLVTDASSLTAAIVRDGATGGGDYDVPDQGRGSKFLHDDADEFAVLRLSIVVDYETLL